MRPSLDEAGGGSAAVVADSSHGGGFGADPTDDWRAESLRAALAGDWPGVEVEVVASVASTNTALLERARGAGGANDASEPTAGGVQVRRSVESGAFGSRRRLDRTPRLLVATRQTAGRGRQGRAWQSAPGASLTFSFAVPLDVADWSGLSLAVGVALAEALDPVSTALPRIGLKWPNDLWRIDGRVEDGRPADVPSPSPAHAAARARGRKLGGILVETVAAGAQRIAVVGVGLNVARFETGEVATGFAALHELAPELSTPEALHRAATALGRALRVFEREGFSAFAARFARRDALCGLAVTTTGRDAPAGVARGVSPSGALRLETADGRVVELTSGEISVRPDAFGTAGADAAAMALAAPAASPPPGQDSTRC